VDSHSRSKGKGRGFSVPFLSMLVVGINFNVNQLFMFNH